MSPLPTFGAGITFAHRVGLVAPNVEYLLIGDIHFYAAIRGTDFAERLDGFYVVREWPRQHCHFSYDALTPVREMLLSRLVQLVRPKL
jgi:hypothetical protein